MSKIQDVSQLTGSSNMYLQNYDTYRRNSNSEPTAFSTMANSQEVYLGDSNNDRQSEMAAETGNTYISETM